MPSATAPAPAAPPEATAPGGPVLAARLLLEEWARRPSPPLPPDHAPAADPAGADLGLPPLSSLEEALAAGIAMAALADADADAGAEAKGRTPGRHVGWKVGWKDVYPSRPVLCGPLFATGLLPAGSAVSLSAHRVFAAEAEYAVRLGRSLPPRPGGPPYSAAEAWAAVGEVRIALELPGARQTRSSDPLHYVADALLGAAVVLGPVVSGRAEEGTAAPAGGGEAGADGDGDPSASLAGGREVRLRVGDNQVSAGTATNNPGGSPAGALAALATELCCERGLELRAGDWVLCGHCCQATLRGRPRPPLGGAPPPEWGMAEWGGGDLLRAEFDGLGAVEATLMP